jgi:hypothetical protein
MRTPASWKIGVVVVWLLVLVWFPWEVNLSGTWLGPAPCWGQIAAEIEPNPESISVGSFIGTSFSGSISIIGNTMTEVNSNYGVELSNAFHGFTGISQINQTAGTLNSQINVIGIAGLQGGGELRRLSLNYKSQVANNTLSTSASSYQVGILGTSFAGGAGVVMVNQSAGNMNTQFNAFNLAIGPMGANGARGLTDIELCAVKANNFIIQDPAAPNKYSTKLDLEGGAFHNFTGMWSSNQVAGNQNQVATVFNVNVITMP